MHAHDDRSPSEASIRLRLYVAGDGPRSLRAIETVRELAVREAGGRCELEVVDVTQEPERAEQDRILATPTLLKLSPAPTRRILGDLTQAWDLVVPPASRNGTAPS